MSTQNDLLDGNDSNLERLSDEAPEQSDMCLNWQDDVDNNFPICVPDACGDGSIDVKIQRVKGEKNLVLWGLLKVRFFKNG